MARKARRNEPPKKKKETASAIDVAPALGPPWLRRALTVAGALYILCVLIEAVPAPPRDARRRGSRTHLYDIVPRPILYFCQIAALFPRAATHRIEYRAEGLPCQGPAIEIDVRPVFPLHADDKENRFDRALHFYAGDRASPNDRPTLEALESYVMDAYNSRHPDKVRGVVFLSLRAPIPQPGTPFPRYERAPLADFPKEQRKVWYATSRDVVDRRCAGDTP